jgi:intracellular multiplication protein IcmQ
MDNEKEKIIKFSKQLITELDSLLNTGDWEKSLFLRAMAKRINNIREDTQDLVEELNDGDSNSIIENSNFDKTKEGYVKVYISLYQADGNNLQIWQIMLKSLAKYSINRPIYAKEEDVKAMIRSKADPIRHSYVVIMVTPDSIIKPESQQTDNLGHELLALKENSIETENIVSFVHANKKNYIFHDNKLILKDVIE